MAGYQGTKLQVAIETYFDYGASRLDMFSNLIDIDLNLKKLQYQKKRQLATIEELRKSKDKAEETISGGTAMVQRLQLKSNLIQAFRSFESDALENFFLQAAAYR